ncbi:MAG: class I SAM-dependent methyltransferase [Microbacterium sp.]|nr:class I SAM-dependent methyltransferase [Microbacterium sp.]
MVSIDTFGRLLRRTEQALERGELFFPEVTEWDSGRVAVGNALRYFATFERWPDSQQDAVDATGPVVLDVGAGAGRHALHLQASGRIVVPLDIDPVAVEVMRDRGLDAHLGDIVHHVAVAPYDTLIFLGGNGSLLVNAPDALMACARLLRPGGRVIAEVGHQSMAHGGAKVRVRFEEYASPWIEYAAARLDTFRTMVETRSEFRITGWRPYRSTTLVTITRTEAVAHP